MKTVRYLICAATLVLFATNAQAQDFSFEGNVSVISDYVASGVSQTQNRPALQVTGTAYLDNFYIGVFGSNVNFGPGSTDRHELDVFAGYWHQFAAGLLVDVGYEHYFYNATGSCCGALYANAATYIGDQFRTEATVKYDPRARLFDTRLGAEFYPTEAVSLRAAIGRSEQNAHNYSSLGADYAVSDAAMTSIDYHTASSGWTRDKLVIGLNFSF